VIEMDTAVGNAPRVPSRNGEFLLKHSQLGHALLDIAETAKDSEIVRRNVQNALYALETIDKHLAEVKLDAHFQAQLQHTRDRLNARLECFQSMIGAWTGSFSSTDLSAKDSA